MAKTKQRCSWWLMEMTPVLAIARQNFHSTLQVVGSFYLEVNYWRDRGQMWAVTPLKMKLGIFHSVWKCLCIPWCLVEPLMMFCRSLVGKHCSNKFVVILYQWIKTVSLWQAYGKKNKTYNSVKFHSLTSCENSFIPLM